MIKDFDETKRQLHELAAVVNEFKSEAVQFRILELIIEAGGIDIEVGPSKEDVQLAKEKKTRSRKRKRISKRTASTKRKPGRPRTKKSRPGPGAMIDRLISEGYFKTRRTINDIIEYCKKNLAFTYISSELSPALGRAVRGDKLKREQNQENQYEYFEE